MSGALVERAQQGDRDAYELLARGKAGRLFLVASRILRDTDAAEDAVHRRSSRSGAKHARRGSGRPDGTVGVARPLGNCGWEALRSPLHPERIGPSERVFIAVGGLEC